MEILVTGGAGYIGSHTCVELLNSGHKIAVADNFSNSHPKVLERIRYITGRDSAFYEMDIRDEVALSELFNAHSIECVIHFAGLKAVGESVKKPLEYYDNNVNSTLSLCKVMKRHNVRQIIFSSSATVYRADNPMPVSEEGVTGCINPYGWTKYMCEQILRDAARADGNWSVTLLRYFNPIGAHESGLIGEAPSDIPNNLLPYISQTAIGKLKELSVYGDDYDTVDGTGVRDYIHVIDLAKGHVAAAAWCSKNIGVEAINLGSGSGTSVLQMVCAFEQVNGVCVPYRIVGRRPGDLATCYANPEKAKKILNWSTQKDIHTMCADIWRWQKQNPDGYL